jgi:HD-GYP domain-containing protein (c-di-GMP phosphodiesterase class II)
VKPLAHGRTAQQGASLASLAARIRDAGGVLLPADPLVLLPEALRADGLLQSLLSSPYGRRIVAQACERTASGAAWTHLGVSVVPLPVARTLGGGAFVAATILEEALEGDDLAKLASHAKFDARIVRSMLREEGLWRASALPRFQRTVVALARAEAERLAGIESGAQLSTAWEELHLLHSLAEAMGQGIAPADFARRTLAEARRTLGCRWTAMRVDGAAAEIVGIAPGAVLVDGDDHGLAETVLREGHAATQAVIVDPQLVVAPLGQEGARFGAFAAGGLVGPDGEEDPSGMSSVERTLVGTAAGNLSVFIDNARLARDRDALFEGALSALVATIDAKDRYTCGHSGRVADLAARIAAAAGFSEREVAEIHFAGLMHDVGKIAVPEAVLCKEGRLTDEEFALVKQHPERGYEILRNLPDSRTILDGVRHHHERYDGRGYPHGLAGEAIPAVARIIAIADTFDAMTSTRTYRRALSQRDVLAEMRLLAGSQFDPKFLRIFLALQASGDASIPFRRSDEGRSEAA